MVHFPLHSCHKHITFHPDYFTLLMLCLLILFYIDLHAYSLNACQYMPIHFTKIERRLIKHACQARVFPCVIDVTTCELRQSHIQHRRTWILLKVDPLQKSILQSCLEKKMVICILEKYHFDRVGHFTSIFQDPYHNFQFWGVGQPHILGSSSEKRGQGETTYIQASSC